MIQITRVRIELPEEAVINCDITTDESAEEYKARIKADLQKYNINASVDIISRSLDTHNYTAKSLTPFIGKKVRSKFGEGVLIDVKESEVWSVDDQAKIRYENNRFMTVPANTVSEILEG
jgi:hypothetical protein